MPRFCDIVMKGGITSGVVYPAAVAEIAKSFTFKNIGGTSAGAIAAAITAAAERRRARDGSTDGFARVDAIPAYLAADDHLYRLFVPNANTRSLYRTVVGLFGRARFQPAMIAKWCGLVWAFPVPSLIGAVFGAIFLVAVTRTYAETALWLWLLALLAAIFTVFGGITVAVIVALARDLLGTLPGNFYGMVTGVDDTNRPSENALCTWLAAELERTAGLEPGATPLTFGMLWDAKRDPNASGPIPMPAEPDVNLEMITTNVTWGRPYTFPVTTHVFFFDPTELKRFFPDYVVDWMVQRARKPRDADEAARFVRYAPRLPLPEMSDLPVILATRMSLAFPVLLSAVPLWSADRSVKPAIPGEFELEHVWFSDGGISSNFPITLFDSPLPRWPTFAISLSGLPPGRTLQADEAQNVFMIERNGDGLLPTFSRFRNFPGFLSAIGNAVQNWNDTTQSTLPGYRDRIVTVFLDDDEGGLNLDMPPAILERLRKRGAAAGALIAGRFSTPSVLDPDAVGMNWENHRWLRYRSAMGSIKSYLTQFARSAGTPSAPDVSYDALVGAQAGTPQRSYPIAPADRAAIIARTDALAALGGDLAATEGIEDKLPKPPPQLVVRSSLQT